jgi:formate-dependent nitrite reductase cytochrome c552 subunit
LPIQYFDVKIPDISTNALAQKAIGLDMEKVKANKEVFKNSCAKTARKKQKTENQKIQLSIYNGGKKY